MMSNVLLVNGICGTLVGVSPFSNDRDYPLRSFSLEPYPFKHFFSTIIFTNKLLNFIVFNSQCHENKTIDKFTSNVTSTENRKL